MTYYDREILGAHFVRTSDVMICKTKVKMVRMFML